MSIENKIILRHPESPEELSIYSRWAELEQWAPGDELSAVHILHCVDRDDLYLCEVDGQPAAIVACIRHGAAHGWVGLYICDPTLRGKGHGLRVWRHALDGPLCKDRVLGLTAVPEQVPNYSKSGFSVAYRDFRFGCTSADVLTWREPIGESADGGSCRAMLASDIADAVEYDAGTTQVDRRGFVARWLSLPINRGAIFHDARGGVAGYGAIRPAGGKFRVGPVIAETRDVAQAILYQLVVGLGLPKEGAPASLLLDVSEINPSAVALVESIPGVFKLDFYCVRMYRGAFDSTLASEKEYCNTSWELCF